MNRYLPILMYHHVNPVGNFINCTPDRFEAQMRYLSSKGYNSLTIEDIDRTIREGNDLPPRSIMITFDDGWLDNYFYAYPVMKRYRLKGVLFVVTSWIADRGTRKDIQPLPPHKNCLEKIRRGEGGDVIVSWDELREMEAEGVMDVQSHTHSHLRWDREYNDIETCKDALYKDLLTARHILKEQLGKESRALCWPWGINKPWYKDVALKAGYKYLFTTEKGCNTLEDKEAFKRIVIGNIGLFDFRKKLFIHSNLKLSRLYLKVFGK